MSKVVKTDQRRDRSIETLYTFPDDAVAGDLRDEPGTPQLSIYSYHDKDRKLYRSSISRKVRRGMVVTMAITYGRDDCPLPDYVRSSYEPTARYSAKGLEEFHQFAVDQLEAMPGPVLDQVFQWAKDGAKDKVLNG